MKKSTRGQQGYSDIIDIEIILKKNKFMLNEKKFMNRQGVEDEGDIWVYDGKKLSQVDYSRKQLKWIKVSGFDKIPFWKMNLALVSLKKLKATGEEEIAGRKCRMFEIKLPHDGGEEIFMYWVDKEKNIVLKKMHILTGGGFVLIGEIYECEKVEFDPVVPDDTFKPGNTDGYESIKKLFVGHKPLETNF